MTTFFAMVKRPARVSALEARMLGTDRCMGGFFNRSWRLLVSCFSRGADGLGGYTAGIRLMQSYGGLPFNTRVDTSSQRSSGDLLRRSPKQEKGNGGADGTRRHSS